MAMNSSASGRGHQPPARLLEFVAITLLFVLPIPLYIAHAHRPLAVVLHIGLVAPLFWTRKAPEFVFAVIAAVAFVQWLVYEPSPSDVALLIGLFSVAASRPLRHTVVAAGVLEFGVLLVVLGHTTLGGGVTEGPGPLRAHIFDFIFLSGLTTAAAVLGTNMQTRRAYLHAVEERAARLEAERDQQAQLAVAGERARVAREMHDIVAHNLAVMVALTDGAALTLRADPDRAEIALREASEAGRTALTDMRRVLGLLRGSVDDSDRVPPPQLVDLESLIDTVRRTGLEVYYKSGGDLSASPEAIQLSGYRIVQEALTNVMKHATGATRVAIHVRASKSRLVVIVEDDGRSSAAGSVAGHGLAGMRERAALHSGVVSAGSTRRGWRVLAQLYTNEDEG